MLIALLTRFPLPLPFVPAVLLALGAVIGGEPDARIAERPSAVDAELHVTSLTGQEIRPFSCAGKGVKAAVVVFIATDCPIANQYAPELERIRAEYENRGVKLTLIHADPDLSEKAARQHAEEYSLKSPVIIDRTHRLVLATGAKVTPEAFVIDTAGRIRYRGRINDQFTGFGARRKQPGTHDLRNAIDAVLAGRAVELPETKPVGCLIPVPGRVSGREGG